MVSVVLGIDTATDVRVGLARDGSVLASEAFESTRAHAEQLLPLVQQVMATSGVAFSELTAVHVGVGPGPFTGLRVGVAAAITLAEVLGIEVRGVCSLDVVAAQWAGTGLSDEFVVVADARRSEVYWARYSADGIRREGPFVSAPGEVPDLALAGPGAQLTGRPVGGPALIDAGLLAASDALPAVGTEPLYLRRPDATVPTTRKSTLAQPRIAMMVAEPPEAP
ncbi:MAG TPA: tRNA (adenosine(37)-N6)-threonylcarbamoyltransferase complex dimerization subunit type 1 TsaB [Propionibacteriaceae bacterium]|nr:tRNA (adenosine(37)-N6)-threonylcarbamoyltransferase complex dimerization subunit type 1 TsaB [Propionibacteriaceae bacterium]